MPGVVGADIRASAVYGQGMGHNPDAAPYGEQEEDKSDKEEFKSSVRVTGIGIILLGIIGFIIFLIFKLVLP